MHLRSVTLKGFKSFPDRTRLEFAPGVSVVVGPNGSGKSNITDAVLWALGEQSPLAVRGQSMQDVIFAGGQGLQARPQAEVEVVLDNGDGTVDLPLSEISIQRRLDRTGDGEYRVNGARCRLADILELLSDTGLGKEMHSVVSQGRVTSIVSSRPRERRLLIEEAAGLGKHRKRRRRAQLKLERTHDNLDRALDVEREARTRLKPLKRQAEAAELHERLERQTDEARWILARAAMRAAREALAGAEQGAAAARAAAAEAERALAAVAGRREEAEAALAARGAERERLSARFHSARGAGERVAMRVEGVKQALAGLEARAARRAAGVASLEREAQADAVDEGAGARIATLEAELEQLAADREERLRRDLEDLEHRRAAAEGEAARLAVAAEAGAGARREAEAAVERARAARREAESAADRARREAARTGAELASVNQFLRARAGSPGGVPALADALAAAPGYELALAAALGTRMRAAVAADLATATALLDRATKDGGAALVASAEPAVAVGSGSPSAPGAPAAGTGAAETGSASASGAAPARAVAVGSGSPSAPDAPAAGAVAAETGSASAPGAAPARAVAAGDRLGETPSSEPPAPGAERLLDHVRPAGDGAAFALAEVLLADVWIVEDVAAVSGGFAGVVVTCTGRVWAPGQRELRQEVPGGEDRVLAERNRREQLTREVERAAQGETAAQAAVEAARTRLVEADRARDEADRTARAAARAHAEAVDEERHVRRRMEQRRNAPDEGEAAQRRTRAAAALQAERKLIERAEREREQRRSRIAAERARLERERALMPRTRALLGALEAATGAIAQHVEGFERALREEREAGEQLTAALRACAAEEQRVQAELRNRGEAVTRAEVAAQRARDAAADAGAGLAGLAERLGLAAEPAEEPLSEDEQTALEGRIERLAKRRAQLGPVNPLAQDEYAEALAHVEELEAQREDLETAIRELQQLIRDTDRRIREAFEETFAAASKNFEEVVGELFPGGRGRLRLVREDAGPRPVIGGPAAGEDEPSEEQRLEEAIEAAAETDGDKPDDLLGIEIEITPAGKATKRLSLLSGGEKSLTALAFLFAVFLARPCPFYILDEVEAALDDSNIDRFLSLLRRVSGRAQFIVVTHQKRTMEAADCLYGVSMAGNGVSKVVSRRLPQPSAGSAAA